jgi:Protein of unknown function (DUF2442)
MSTSRNLADSATSAAYQRGEIILRMKSGRVIRFAAASNPRLAKASPRQLRKMELSPFGVHWPELDEDLSFRGLLKGSFR